MPRADADPVAATLTLDPAFTVGPVDSRLFGSFVEHLGRCVYTGIFEPGHPSADERGFRSDVLDLVRELGATVVRYPGGNFVSGYRWEDGTGRAADRPRRLDLAWHAIESNAFGTGEFVDWCREAGAEPMLALNLGTRGMQEAVDLLEYCNHPGGTRLSDLRREHGAAEPYDVRLWCLGNEMDGPWQVGHRSAAEYGALAARTARAMRLVDPRVELVACGSSHSGMPTFGSWEATVLEQCYDTVDLVSLHSYYDPTGKSVPEFLAGALDLDRSIDAVVATADHVGARLRSRKRLQVSVDEWNVWYVSRWDPAAVAEWREAGPLLEDTYDDVDATMVASLLVTLLRHADRVGVACLAQLVNVIAPIRTEPGGRAWRQTTFAPFAQIAAAARGSVLRAEPRVATYESEVGDVPLVDATATYDEESGELALMLVNRSVDRPARVRVDVRAFGDALAGSAPDGLLEIDLDPVSWRVVRPATDPRPGS
ncbi:alpha-N-arabinofuranosidase [Nocardioides sp.]|uniref:arabinosylfuranosidase ArfA n=1 Tax=Nocardioides sp. TaxID=35761 RepID=UPI00262A84BA|nr:alpha-N-arabinofuranosidase [Nocardioides sp.]MDI6908917.1 alpha-N-arabinofuranosidase [Nocardioides sp.]